LEGNNCQLLELIEKKKLSLYGYRYIANEKPSFAKFEVIPKNQLPNSGGQQHSWRKYNSIISPVNIFRSEVVYSSVCLKRKKFNKALKNISQQ